MKTTKVTWSSWRSGAAPDEVEIWAYCLMPNHVHLIAVPHSADGMRRAIGEVHRRYTAWSTSGRDGGGISGRGGSPHSCSMSPICSLRYGTSSLTPCVRG